MRRFIITNDAETYWRKEDLTAEKKRYEGMHGRIEYKTKYDEKYDKRHERIYLNIKRRFR
jgi:hypothetical protein